jgi:hypothetical protein
MKRALLVLMVLVMVLSLSACTGDSNSELATRTEEVMSQANAMIGMPNVVNFTEKIILKDIYELCDDADLITYAYTQNMNGKYVYIGQCIGFGVPYSAQFSNPEVYEYHGNGSVTLPQAEPNGIFKPDGLSATWLIVINPETGKREVEYWEPTIIVKQSKLPKRVCEDWSLPSDY